MKRVLILGATGMLGNACLKVFDNDKSIEVLGTSRKSEDKYLLLDAKNNNSLVSLKEYRPNWIINCIGVIKPHINEASIDSIQNAIEINAKFPIDLARYAKETSARIIQIATDCVYSGKKGMYIESDLHDATDVYGKTKSLGEVPSENIMHLRSSIIGPEVGKSTSLLEWFLTQPNNAQINGFSDHLWNGITTHQFAKISLGLIKSNYFNHGVQHIIPGDIVTKAHLLNIFSKTYNRKDIKINETMSSNHVDRTLSTNQKDLNLNIWELAGYKTPPGIAEMVSEQAHFNQPL
jgi:dTDP-4-dehydrorhamnose reductase